MEALPEISMASVALVVVFVGFELMRLSESLQDQKLPRAQKLPKEQKLPTRAEIKED